MHLRSALRSFLAPILLLAACTGGGGTEPTPGHETPPPPPESQTILIGEYGSLTGSEANFGISTHNGILLALDEINAAGGLNGKKLELRNYDDQGKAQEAGTAVTRLITSDHVTAIIGEVASSLSIAGGRVAQQNGVPMISPSSTNPAVTQIGDMIFRVCFIDSFQGYVVGKFAHDDLKLTKVAVLYDQSQAYSKGLKDDFIREFTAMGGTITSEQAYQGGDQDFNAQLTTIRGTTPEAIFIPGYYTDVGNIAQQAKKLGITVPLLGGDGWDSISGEAVDGHYYSTHYAPEDQRPEVQKFVTEYKTRHKVVPDSMAVLGYDATNLLFDAMKRAPSLSGKDLAKAISETKDFQGVTGKITIDENRNARKAAVVVQMQASRPVYKSTIEPK